MKNTYLALFDQENIRWKKSLLVRLYTMYIWIRLFVEKGQWINILWSCLSCRIQGLGVHFFQPEHKCQRRKPINMFFESKHTSITFFIKKISLICLQNIFHFLCWTDYILGGVLEAGKLFNIFFQIQSRSNIRFI